MECRQLPGNSRLIGVALLLAAHTALAQINVNSSPNTVGSGARALGMGGAFIAVADDATSASWNPGGLTQLESAEASLVYSWKFSTESFSSGSEPGLGGDFDLTLDEVNYASIVYPIPWTFAGRNFVVSLNYQRKYDFDRKLHVTADDYAILSTGTVASAFFDVNYEQSGNLSALSPAFGFEVTDRLSMGVVANLWDQSLISTNEWENVTSTRSRVRLSGGSPIFSRSEFIQKYEDFEGTNFTLGALYRATERLSIGAVYNTPFTAKMNSTRTLYTNGFRSMTLKEPYKWEFPASYGLGVAYRFPNDKMTLSMDITKREWDDFVEIRPRHGLREGSGLGQGGRLSPITGNPKSMSPHDPTYTIRLGGEYVFIDAKKPVQKFLPSLRAGVFYDPEPAGGQKDLANGRLGPGNGEPDDYYGFTLGAGLLIKNRVNLDAAYQYRRGNGVRKDTFGFADTTADVAQHEFYLSTVIYF